MDLGPRAEGGSMVVGGECKWGEGLHPLHIPRNIPETHSHTIVVNCILVPCVVLLFTAVVAV